MGHPERPARIAVGRRNAPVETTISIDSIDLSPQGSGAWRRNKSYDSPRDFAKLHLLNGTRTRATLSPNDRRSWQDSTQLKPLLAKKPFDAAAEDLTGDSAYRTRPPFKSTRESDSQLCFKPKGNARHWVEPKDTFERMTNFEKAHAVAQRIMERDRDAARRRQVPEP